MVANIIFLASHYNLITADLIGAMSNDLIRFVASAFFEVNGEIGGAIIFDIIHGIINTGTHVLAVYVEGEGIKCEWLVAFFNVFNSDWSHDLIRQLAEFRR